MTPVRARTASEAERAAAVRGVAQTRAEETNT